MPHNRFQISPKTIPLAFALLIILSYGLLLTRTGFYWDDWPFAWGAHFFGPESFLHSFLRVRPFLGPIFYVTTSLLPESPLAWQIFALIIRFGLTLAFWWSFTNLWPNRPRQNLFAALIFLVYPAYSQHWVAFTHINQELIPLFFYILSFGATGWAIHAPHRFLPRTIIALLLLLLGVFPTEYFLTIEPLRFLFLLTILNSPSLFARIGQAFKLWISYLIVWSLNVGWLIFFYRSGIYANYDVAVDVEAPAANLLVGFITAAADSIYKAGFFAYAQILPLLSQTFPSPSALFSLALIVITFLALIFYLTHLSIEKESAARSRAESVAIILIGLIGIVMGRIPSWAAGLPLTLQSSHDRFTISMIIAASLLAVGLVELVTRNHRKQIILISLLVALGVGQQFYNANLYRRDWERQRDVYWQLIWRMPALQPGTILFTDTTEFDHQTDYHLTAALNWMYAPNLQDRQIPYLIFGVDMRQNPGSIEPDTPIEFAYRPAHFSGNVSQSIAFQAPLRGCVRILSSEDQEAYPNLSERMRQAITLSNLDNIQAQSAPPSASTRYAIAESLLGPEPAHGWCYYYARAELARQQQDWAAIAGLDEQAITAGLSPSDPLEWLPFVEAGASLGQFEHAAERTRQALAQRPFLRKPFCAAWQRASQRHSQPDGLLEQLDCPP